MLQSQIESISQILYEISFAHSGRTTRKLFEEFCLGLNLEQDNEPGGPDGVWAWVQEQVASQSVDDVHTTIIFKTLEYPTSIVATASFVPDDRGVAKKLGLDKDRTFFGFWGFFQVHRDWRRKGIGTYIASYMDQHVQTHVNRIGVEKTVYLFTGIPHAAKMYERLGFVDCGESINLPEFGFDEQLYKKTYQPQSSL